MDILSKLATDPDATITGEEVAGYIEKALDNNYEVDAEDGTVVYSASAYQTATHTNGATLTYTYSYTQSTRELVVLLKKVALKKPLS